MLLPGVTCDHDHWHRWLWEPKRRCLWAPTRVLSGRHKDLRSCGDGSLYHHLCNPASCICLKAEEQQRPRLKKQVCSPFSKFKRGKEPHWKPLPCCMKHTSLANTKYQIPNTYQTNCQYQISDQLPIPNIIIGQNPGGKLWFQYYPASPAEFSSAPAFSTSSQAWNKSSSRFSDKRVFLGVIEL